LIQTLMSTPVVRLLSQSAFRAGECFSALHGRKLPLNLGGQTARLCVIGGLRKHIDFANSDAVDELCRAPGQEVFARARNAGMIMNDQLPGTKLLEHRSWYPYCIWYPRVASEETYRRLAAAVPDMRYQVGRACAVAGYFQLYDELDLLPDPTIAEEARENKQGPAAGGAALIYERIMAAPTRYSVMNDYERTVELDNAKPGAHLNADTAVVASLEQRKRPAEDYGSAWKYFDITEDGGIDVKTVELPPTRLSASEAALLDSPLPVDLPTIHKDLMILVAAFEGNLDRYARLRRPGRSIEYELHCVLHGIYKSTALAHWLDRNREIMELVAASWHPREVKALKRAILARRVINNDIHHIINANPAVPDDELLYWIWHPTLPSQWTLLKLSEARPAMRSQCARACMAGGMRDTYLTIMDMRDDHGNSVSIDRFLKEESETCPDHKFFCADITRRMADQGLDRLPYAHDDMWKASIPWRDADISSTSLYSSLGDDCHTVVHEGQEWGMYEELGAELGRVRLYLSSLPEIRARARDSEGVELEVLYP
jgi:hypothetical protein